MNYWHKLEQWLKQKNDQANKADSLQACIESWTARLDLLKTLSEDDIKNFIATFKRRYCPLCKFYFNKRDDSQKFCAGCPISAKTGKPVCADVPLMKYINNAQEHKLNELITAIEKSIEFGKQLHGELNGDANPTS